MMIFIYFRATSREHTWQDNVKAEETSLNYDYKHRKTSASGNETELKSSQTSLNYKTISRLAEFMLRLVSIQKYRRFILYYETNTWYGKSPVLRDKSCIPGLVTRPILGGALMVTICIVSRLFQSVTHFLKYHIS